MGPLAFSTLGCPDLGLKDVLNVAQRFGIKGLELRAGDTGLIDVNMSALGRSLLRQELLSADMQVLSVASYVKVADPTASDDAIQAELIDHLQLAHDIGAAGVRVFPGGTIDRSIAENMKASDELAARRLGRASTDAGRLGVGIYIETHDSHPRRTDIARILTLLDKAVPDHRVAAIWDVMHPWVNGELPSETFKALEPWLVYLQIKDATPEKQLTLVGHGAIPLSDIVKTVEGQNYWISLEWARAWHPQLPDVSVALEATLQWASRHKKELG